MNKDGEEFEITAQKIKEEDEHKEELMKNMIKRIEKKENCNNEMIF